MAVTASSLQAVAASWKEFGLDSRRAALDESALGIASAQETSARSRKRLSESVKSFKAQLKQQQAASPSNATNPADAGTLRIIKSFQQEVDELTRRAKSAESAFMSVYQHVFELPDAAPYLQAAHETQQQLDTLRASHDATAAELEEYRLESTKIRSQTLTVRKLEERVRRLEEERNVIGAENDMLRKRTEEMEGEMAEMVASAELGGQVRDGVNAMGGTEDVDGANGEAASGGDGGGEGTSGADQLSSARRELDALRKEYFKIDKELMIVLAERDELRENRQRELDFVASEGMRTEEDLRREVAELKMRVDRQDADEGLAPADAGIPDIPDNNDAARLAELEELVAAREAAISTIQSENTNLRAAVDRATAEGNDSATTIHELRAELAARPSASELKLLQQQVRTLRALNMNYIDDDDEDDDDDDGTPLDSDVLDGTEPSGTAGGDRDRQAGDGDGDADNRGGGSVQLERLLLSKNRRLEAELVSIRNQLHHSQASLNGNERHSQSLERIVSEQRRLIEQLEEEAVIKVQSAGAVPQGAEGGGPAAGKGDVPEDDGSATLIKALADQRDRAKERLQKLEEEMAAEKEEHKKVFDEVNSLKEDNVKLFEKLKYVEQYRQSTSAHAGPPASAGGGGKSLEAKYNQMYNDRVTVESNPFENFRKEERTMRQSKSLMPHDKIALSGVRLLLSNRVTRAGLLFYLGVLHLLVMVSLLRRHHACHDAIALHHSEAPLVSGGGINGNGMHFP